MRPNLDPKPFRITYERDCPHYKLTCGNPACASVCVAQAIRDAGIADEWNAENPCKSAQFDSHA